MKKLFLLFLFVSGEAFAACHLQRNSIGFDNYEICEVDGAGYTCVSLENKNSIACFPTTTVEKDMSGYRKPRNLSGSDY